MCRCQQFRALRRKQTQRNKVHIGNGVFKTCCHEHPDREKNGKDFSRCILYRNRAPNGETDEPVAKNSEQKCLPKSKITLYRRHSDGDTGKSIVRRNGQLTGFVNQKSKRNSSGKIGKIDHPPIPQHRIKGNPPLGKRKKHHRIARKKFRTRQHHEYQSTGKDKTCQNTPQSKGFGACQKVIGDRRRSRTGEGKICPRQKSQQKKITERLSRLNGFGTGNELTTFRIQSDRRRRCRRSKDDSIIVNSAGRKTRTQGRGQKCMGQKHPWYKVQGTIFSLPLPWYHRHLLHHPSSFSSF